MLLPLYSIPLSAKYFISIALVVFASLISVPVLINKLPCKFGISFSKTFTISINKLTISSSGSIAEL